MRSISRTSGYSQVDQRHQYTCSALTLFHFQLTGAGERNSNIHFRNKSNRRQTPASQSAHSSIVHQLTISFHPFPHHGLDRSALEHPAIMPEENDFGGATTACQNEGKEAVGQWVQEVVCPLHHHHVAALLPLLPEVILRNKDTTPNVIVMWGSAQKWYKHLESLPISSLHNQFPPFFSVLHCPLGLGKLQACLLSDVVFPPLLLSALSSFPPFTVPCKMVLARPDERETCPYHFSLHFFMMVRRSLSGPIVCWTLAQTSYLVPWSLYEMCSIMPSCLQRLQEGLWQVWHAALWATMRKYSISANLIWVIKHIDGKPSMQSSLTADRRLVLNNSWSLTGISTHHQFIISMINILPRWPN